MCGRYVITNAVTKTKNMVKTAIKLEDSSNYNAHPYQDLPIIKKYTNGNTLESLKWGIVPTWVKKKEFKPLINARIETINEKVSFKHLIKKNKCVVIADGFYEWKRSTNNKTPFYLYEKDKKNLFIAAIYQNDQFCMITENASENICEVHNRQPVILYEKDVNKYLKIDCDGKDILKNLKRPKLQYYEVSKQVNKPVNNYPTLIQSL